ncbi:hypothetical protein E4U44_005684 [Claviceps purpurea]|nr:hypothetical protein E4U44_005684 [Claviceps purpurea]
MKIVHTRRPHQSPGPQIFTLAQRKGVPTVAPSGASLSALVPQLVLYELTAL